MNAASEYPRAALTYATNTHSIHTHLLYHLWLAFHLSKGKGMKERAGGAAAAASPPTLANFAWNLFAICGGNTSNNNCCTCSSLCSVYSSLFLSLILSFSTPPPLSLCRLLNMLWNCITFSKSSLAVCSCLVSRACCLLPAGDKRLFMCVCVRVCVCCNTFLTTHIVIAACSNFG